MTIKTDEKTGLCEKRNTIILEKVRMESNKNSQCTAIQVWIQSSEGSTPPKRVGGMQIEYGRNYDDEADDG